MSFGRDHRLAKKALYVAQEIREAGDTSTADLLASLSERLSARVDEVVDITRTGRTRAAERNAHWRAVHKYAGTGNIDDILALATLRVLFPEEP